MVSVSDTWEFICAYSSNSLSLSYFKRNHHFIIYRPFEYFGYSISIWELLSIKLQQIFLVLSFDGQIRSFLLGVKLGMNLPDYKISKGLGLNK